MAFEGGNGIAGKESYKAVTGWHEDKDRRKVRKEDRIWARVHFRKLPSPFTVRWTI
jgi:hypothetical protein